MDVAILGGGIAGLATAIAMRRLGLAVSVFERRRSAHNLGAGVVCWPNASFVLSKFGLLDELRSVAGTVTEMRRISRSGTDLGTLDIRQLDAAMGFPSLSVLRKDFMRILMHCADRLGVQIHFERRAITIDSTESGCHVRFADGTSVTPTLVIGADGRMDSVARQYITGDNRPVFQGFVNWIGTVSLSVVVMEQMAIRDYWGVGARFGIVPVSPTRAYWAGGVRVSEDAPDDRSEGIALLQRTFADWPSPVSDVVSSTSGSNTKRITLFDHDPASRWHRDNVLMIGDAAHAALPTSGQGAAQALEDAWFFAREFAAAPQNHETAMTTFTEKRLKKTTSIIMAGRNLAASLFNDDPDACRVRDMKAKQADYVAMANGMATAWSAGLPIGT